MTKDSIGEYTGRWRITRVLVDVGRATPPTSYGRLGLAWVLGR